MKVGYNMKNLNEYDELCKQILIDCDIPFVDCPVTASKRMSRAWGNCHWTRRGGTESFKIHINHILLDDSVSDKALENTILHELLHTVKGCQDHGAKWSHYADIVNREYGYDIRRTDGDVDDAAAKLAKAQVRNSYKYKVFCPSCGAKWLYSRASKTVQHPDWYRCGKCKTTLQVEYLTRDTVASVANAI